MTGKRYYMTTIGDWRRHAGRFANSHFVVLEPCASDSAGAWHGSTALTTSAMPGAALPGCDHVLDPADETAASPSRSGEQQATENGAEVHERRQASAPGLPAGQAGMACHAPSTVEPLLENGARILVLIEADEGVHFVLEDDAAFEALPHPLALRPISDAAQAALAAHGVSPGATTFDAAEAVARVHPLLRHRVF